MKKCCAKVVGVTSGDGFVSDSVNDSHSICSAAVLCILLMLEYDIR